VGTAKESNLARLRFLGVDDLARILQAPRDSLIAQFRKLVSFHGADLVFTDAAVREVAGIALERNTGARDLRLVIEEVLEGVLIEVEAGVRYVITDRTIHGGEMVRQRVEQMRAPLNAQVRRRLMVRKPS
jgi:ATP-dependent Clp protease ATP-binding subunit ClpX